jgi:rSAM/selenodomain-associated transferase 1
VPYATVPPPPQRLLVFARVPELGRVKTRLAASIGEERALAVYGAMLQDVLTSIGDSTADTEIEILWAPTESADGETLASAFPGRTLAMQTGERLGDRLAMAFSERFFFQRTAKIVAIGVDDPLLPRALIDRAFLLLDSCDWVIGPAADGGYYLIGCRGEAFDTAIFRDVEWGTASVFGTTIERIAKWNSTVAILPERRDIDEVEDLERFKAECPDCQLGALLAVIIQ